MERKFKIKTTKKHFIYGKLNVKPSSKSLIILVHGLTGSIENEPFFNAASFFPKKGFAVARIALYHPAKDARKLINASMKDNIKDIETTVQYFRKRFKNIYLIGHSLTGPCILFSNLDSVKGIVLWDPSNPDIDTILKKIVVKKHGFIYLNFGVQTLISQKLLNQWDEIKMDIYNKAKQVSIPMKVICAQHEILWKGWERYFKIKHPQQKYTLIKNADHWFHDEGSQEKLFYETEVFLKEIKNKKDITPKQKISIRRD